MEKQEIVIIWKINKVSIVGTDLDVMKKDFDHFRGYEKYGLWMVGTFKGGSTL